MSYLTITLKGDSYKIKYSHKQDIQKKIIEKTNKMENLKAEIMNIQKEKKQLMIDLLNERQLILYKNGYNKNMTSDELKKDKRYINYQNLLKNYDATHGTFIDIE
jgi:hypothetical protein